MAPVTLDNLASLLYTVLGKLDRLEHTQRVLREQHDLILGHLSISKFRPNASLVDLDGPDPYQPFRDFREQQPQHQNNQQYRIPLIEPLKGDFSVLGITSPSELPALANHTSLVDEDRPQSRQRVANNAVPNTATTSKVEAAGSRPSSRARALRNSPQYLPPEALDGEWSAVSTPSSTSGSASAAARPRSSRPKERPPPQAHDSFGVHHEERAATAPSGTRAGLPPTADFPRQQSATAARPQAPPPPPAAMIERGTAMNGAAEPIYYPVDMPTGQRVYRRTPPEPAVRARSAHPSRAATPPLAPIPTSSLSNGGLGSVSSNQSLPTVQVAGGKLDHAPDPN